MGMSELLVVNNYPKHLELLNELSGTRYPMNLKEVAEHKHDVTIENPIGVKKLLEWTTESWVCDAIALLWITVEILEPRSKAYLEKCKAAKISMTVDAIDVIRNEPLKNFNSFQGNSFLEGRLILQARIPKAERIGLFLPHGSVVEAKISGLHKTKGSVKLRVTLGTAMYTTKL
jgi:hypothetical protein